MPREVIAELFKEIVSWDTSIGIMRYINKQDRRQLVAELAAAGFSCKLHSIHHNPTYITFYYVVRRKNGYGNLAIHGNAIEQWSKYI